MQPPPPVARLHLSPQGTVTALNDTAAALFGARVGDSVTDLVSNESAVRVLWALARCCEGGLPEPIRTALGDTSVHMSLVPSEGPGALLVAATQPRRRQRARPDGAQPTPMAYANAPSGATRSDDDRVLGEALEMVLQANLVGTWQWDLAEQLVSWDDNMFRLFGEPVHPDRVDTIWQLRVHADDVQRIEGDVDRLIAGEITEVQPRYRIHRADGLDRVLTGRTRVFHDTDGRPAFVFGVNWDVTEQEAVRTALADQRERLDVALQAAQMGSFRWDLKSGAVDFDAHLLSLYGAAHGADPTETYSRAIDPADLAQVEADTARSMETGELRTRFRIHRPDGSSTWLESRARVYYDDAGQPDYAVGVNLDVRASIENERALVAAREAALQASRAKSAFLATMSHEIRTPLNGVVGLAAALARTGLNAHQRDLLRALLASGRALRALIDDILDLSKIEAGGMEVRSAPLSLRGLLAELTDLLGAAAQDKGLTLSWEVAPGTHDLWLGDAPRLRQVLLNVVGNGLKFTDEGAVEVVAEAAAPGVVFTVRDSGIGISDDAQRKLFRPFVQIDGSTTRRHGGTGLGLAISQQLVRHMGGEISVDSVPQEGSTFRFGVAMTRVDAELDPGPQRDEGRLPGSLRVLVAEDNPVNQLVVREQLAALGIRDAAWATDGAEAVTLAHQRAYDVVLMDCQMPTLDGYDATRRIRADGACQNAAVVALTAHATVEDRERCIDAGMDGFVTKPVGVEELAAAILQAMQRREP